MEIVCSSSALDLWSAGCDIYIVIQLRFLVIGNVQNNSFSSPNNEYVAYIIFPVIGSKDIGINDKQDTLCV